MTTILEDGAGTGYKAKVDDHGRLHTVNNNVSHMSHHATYHENAFFAHFETTLSTGSNEPVMILRNLDSTQDLEVYTLYFSANADNETYLRTDDEYSSGGNSITPTNLNRGSGIIVSPSNIQAYEGGSSGDLVLTSTNAKRIVGGFLSANNFYELPLEGAVVLRNQHSLSIKTTAAAGTRIITTMMFAYHPQGTKL